MFKPWQLIVFLLAVVLGVVGFIFWYYSAAPSAPNSAPTNAQETATVPTDDSQPAAAASTGASTDAGLDADLNLVDTQLKTVGNDSESVDQSLNDKPVSQTE